MCNGPQLTLDFTSEEGDPAIKLVAREEWRCTAVLCDDGTELGIGGSMDDCLMCPAFIQVREWPVPVEVAAP